MLLMNVFNFFKPASTFQAYLGPPRCPAAGPRAVDHAEPTAADVAAVTEAVQVTGAPSALDTLKGT